jgi:drug/metabolite transporter (DMT)-like permease
MALPRLLSRFNVPAAPGVAAAMALGLSDVLAKVVLAADCDVLTMLSFRSVVGLAFIAIWLRIGSKPKTDARARSIALGVGIIFAGLVFCLFKAIEAIDVPTAILSYFVYPLLTGLIGSLLGFERLRLRWQGAVCAVAAFFGLAVMIGAHPAGLALAGVAYALAAACCRTAVLLVTRAYLTGADARLTTWYSLISSTLVFIALSLGTQTWNPPQTPIGWLALVGMSIAITIGILFVFVSTVRIGPFRTALIMNLEPLTVTILSALLLGEVIAPIQGIGAVIMLAALVAFQLWRSQP